MHWKKSVQKLSGYGKSSKHQEGSGGGVLGTALRYQGEKGIHDKFQVLRSQRLRIIPW